MHALIRTYSSDAEIFQANDAAHDEMTGIWEALGVDFSHRKATTPPVVPLASDDFDESDEYEDDVPARLEAFMDVLEAAPTGLAAYLNVKDD